jgi:hypothetical protein
MQQMSIGHRKAAFVFGEMVGWDMIPFCGLQNMGNVLILTTGKINST